MVRFTSTRDANKLVRLPEVVDLNAVGPNSRKRGTRDAPVIGNGTVDSDFAIMSDIPMSVILNSNMDWTYKLVYPRKSNQTDIKIYDAHNPDISNDVPLTQGVFNTDKTKDYLTNIEDGSRFVHYRQCYRFFKFSFIVGDPISIEGRQCQLFGVYLDADSGAALPYYNEKTGPAGEKTYSILYAKDIDLSLLIDGSSKVVYTDPRAYPPNNVHVVTCICPPHPKYVDTNNSTIGGPIAYNLDTSGNPIKKPIGSYNTFRNLVPPTEKYTLDNYLTTRNKLVLYWLTSPLPGFYYKGENYYVSWTDKLISNSTWSPIQDMVTPGSIEGLPLNASDVKFSDRFTVARDVPAQMPMQMKGSFIDQNFGNAQRLYLPISKFQITYKEFNDTDMSPIMNVNFQYELANDALPVDLTRPIAGAKLMQLVSSYKFGNCTSTEMSYFTFLAHNSVQLTNTMVDNLESIMAQYSAYMSAVRTKILQQFYTNYGINYFEPFATLKTVRFNDRIEKYGKVYDAIKIMDNVLFMLVTSMTTTVSVRLKSNMSVVNFQQVPIVMHMFNQNLAEGTPLLIHILVHILYLHQMIHRTIHCVFRTNCLRCFSCKIPPVTRYILRRRHKELTLIRMAMEACKPRRCCCSCRCACK